MEKYQWTEKGTKNFWKFFTSHAERGNQFFSKRFASYLCRLISKYSKSGNFLDFGCGDGSLLNELNNKITSMPSFGQPLHGIDYGSDAKAGIDQSIKIDSFDPKNSILPYNQNYFDTICAFEVFEHLTDEKLDFIVSEFRRISTDGGRIIVSVPNNEELEMSHILCPNCNHYFHKMQHLQTFDSTSLVQLFEKHKFRLVKVIETNLNNYNSWLKRFASCFISYPNINLIGVFEKSS